MVSTLLQAPGTVGGAEVLVLFLFMFLIGAIIQIAVTAFLYDDAKKRGSNHATAWALAAFFGGPIVWMLYLVVREDMGSGE